MFFENKQPSRSSATEYIQSLIDSGIAIRAPEKLKDLSVGSVFHLRKDELDGYKERNGVNLDKTESSVNGDYSITHKGPVRHVVFEGKAGDAPDRDFLIIRKTNGSVPGLAFLL